jgi:hypothetical protein
MTTRSKIILMLSTVVLAGSFAARAESAPVTTQITKSTGTAHDIGAIQERRLRRITNADREEAAKRAVVRRAEEAKKVRQAELLHTGKKGIPSAPEAKPDNGPGTAGPAPVKPGSFESSKDNKTVPLNSENLNPQSTGSSFSTSNKSAEPQISGAPAAATGGNQKILDAAANVGDPGSTVEPQANTGTIRPGVESQDLNKPRDARAQLERRANRVTNAAREEAAKRAALRAAEAAKANQNAQ